MPQAIVLWALAALAGVSVVLQQSMNANLRFALTSSAWAGFVSYLGGLICMAVFIVALRDPLPSAALASRVAWWAWGGGLFGAVFIALSILLVPKIGAATFFALLVTGQMLASVTFDHFGLLGLVQRPLDWPRVCGIVALIVGVVLIGLR